MLSSAIENQQKLSNSLQQTQQAQTTQTQPISNPNFPAQIPSGICFSVFFFF
jgi:hypothetical protein